jgi:hypothetical protein
MVQNPWAAHHLEFEVLSAERYFEYGYLSVDQHLTYEVQIVSNPPPDKHLKQMAEMLGNLPDAQCLAVENLRESAQQNEMVKQEWGE